jgi:hypothetical protein
MEVRDFFGSAAARALPRILTQICRDPDSTFYGCCDRDWWHYRIRDFPSIILQQAGYTLALAENRSPPAQCAHLNALAAQTCRFWNGRARRYGAFEEYYPWEQGYPPLAFSTLAVAKLCHLGVVALADVEPGLSVAARQLTTRFESQSAGRGHCRIGIHPEVVTGHGASQSLSTNTRPDAGASDDRRLVP